MLGLRKATTEFKLIGPFLLVVLAIMAVAMVSYLQVRSLAQISQTMFTDQTVPVKQLGLASTSLYRLRGDMYKFISIPAARDNTEAAISADIAEVERQMSQYEAAHQAHVTKAEQDALAQWTSSWAAYKVDVATILSDIKAGDTATPFQSLESGDAHNNRDSASKALDALIAADEGEAGSLSMQSSQIFGQATQLGIAVTMLAALMTIVAGIISNHGLAAHSRR